MDTAKYLSKDAWKLKKQNLKHSIKDKNKSLNSSSDSAVLIIAEAGVNHNGDLKLAKKLIDIASEAGADAVKFQSFITEELVSKSTNKANYQINNKDDKETQFEMLKKLELDKDAHIELIAYCKEKKNTVFVNTF